MDGVASRMDEVRSPAVNENSLSLRLTGNQWLLVAAFTVLVAVGCRDMHLNADSLHYVDMARTLLQDHALATWHLNLGAERVPMTDVLWPPMYSILLAGPLALGLSAEAATWLVAVLSHAVLLWLLVAVARRIEWGLLLSLMLLHMTFRHGIAFRAFSETPFMAFTFGALLALALALQADPSGRSRSRTVWPALVAGLLAAGAALTRHVGLMIIPALVLTALLGPIRSRAHTLRVRASALLAMLAGAGLPLGLWFARYTIIGGSYFGPGRPPSTMPLSEVLFRLGQSFYFDAEMVLFALIVGILGYHVLKRETDDRLRTFALALAGAAAAYIVLHEAGTVASHAMYRMDNPPEGRQFFPGYAAILLVAAALVSLARPPERVLRRRWPLIALLMVPIFAGVLVAGGFAHDLTPPRSPVDEWVEQNTDPDDLIIGWRAWPVRFYTGRPVLQSGMVTEPSVYDGPAVADFLKRFASSFPGAWLLVPLEEQDAQQAVASYRRGGLQLQKVADLNVGGLRHYRGVETVEVYRVTGWRSGERPPGDPGGR